jgi:hypothetical protein
MKKGLLGILAVGMITTAANAGQLSLRFAGGGTEIDMAPGDTATIEVVFAMNSTDTTKGRLTGADLRFDVGDLAAGVGGNYVADDAEAKFTVTSIATAMANWNTAAATIGPFNRLGFFASAGDPAGVSGVVGNGTNQAGVVIMSFDIMKPTSGLPEGDTYIVFRNEDPLPALYNGPNSWGNRFQYDINGNQQFEQGVGNGGDADPRFAYHGYETLSPLIIHNVPEPSALALMALGGLALLRRRN